MEQIQILKNEKLVKQFSCPVNLVQKYFTLAVDIAGGMWNGKDEFKVIHKNSEEVTIELNKRNDTFFKSNHEFVPCR